MHKILVGYSNAERLANQLCTVINMIYNIDQYDKSLLSAVESKFAETGLGKLIQGHCLYQTGEIDPAFDLFAVM